MTFDRAWRAFADEDSRVRAPSDLEARVRAAVAVRRDESRSPRFSRTSLAIAATLGLALAWSVWTSTPPATLDTLDSRPVESSALAAFVAPAERERPQIVPPTRPTSANVTRRSDSTVATLRLSPDPVAALESVQLVRLRLPREALQALGLVLLEPDTSGPVDVDVVVGEDGLPRGIRRVRFEPQ